MVAFLGGDISRWGHYPGGGISRRAHFYKGAFLEGRSTRRAHF